MRSSHRGAPGTTPVEPWGGARYIVNADLAIRRPVAGSIGGFAGGAIIPNNNATAPARVRVFPVRIQRTETKNEDSVYSIINWI